MSIFDFLWQRRGEFFVEEEMLYHYTTLEILERFLEDEGDFYCTNPLMLNDDSELILGLDIAMRYLKEKYGWSEECIERFKIGYKRCIEEGVIVVPWIMSFSREGDSLSQWGMYTDRKEGGVAIGLRRDSLWSAIDRLPGHYSKITCNPESDQGFELRLLPCLYAESDEKLIHELFKQRSVEYQDAFRHLGRLTSYEDMDLKDFNKVAVTIMEISVLVKHESFKQEKEERLILLPKTHSLQDCKILGGKARWQTYIRETQKEGIGNIKYKALRGLFREVKISPHGDTRRSWQLVKFLLKRYNMDYCELKCSELPYNGR